MNAKLIRDGEFLADVFIQAMHRNGSWEIIGGEHAWVNNSEGSWFRMVLRQRIEHVAGTYSLFLETGEVFSLGPLNVSNNDGLPSIHAPVHVGR